MKTWWQAFFDCTVAELILAEPRPHEIEFLLKHLALKAGGTLFDQCCGWGRVAGPMAQSGLEVWGVDASAELIAEGKRRWPDLELSCADATIHLQKPECDAGMNVFSSFGYHQSDDDNQEVLDKLVAAVRQGGRIVVDTINPHRVYQEFQPEMTHRTDCGSTIKRLSELKESGRYLDQIWEFQTNEGHTFERRGVTRLYTLEELAEMLTLAGCTPLVALGDLQSRAYQKGSERLIWVAEK